MEFDILAPMEKVALAAISFFVIVLFIGIFFVSGFTSGNTQDKTSLSYVDEESSLKGNFNQVTNPQQTNQKQIVQNTSTPLPTPAPTQTPSPTPTPSPSPLVKDISVSCRVNPTSATISKDVTWTANATGGTGDYTYTWSGDAPLAGKTGWITTVSYTEEGTKTGTVTVKSGNKESTCKETVTITAGE